ncbi:Pleiotropic drug resistance protein 3, partial [Cucurbita argyrosperma subsp. sororia]
MIEVGEIGRRRSFSSSFGRRSVAEEEEEEDGDIKDVSLWTSIERLPTFERLRSSLFDDGRGEAERRVVVDVTKLGDEERHVFIQNLINHIENDNLKLLRKVKERIHKVGEKFPRVEVEYKNVNIEAKCEIVRGKALPTLWNSLQTNIFGIINFCGGKSRGAKINIIEDVSGVIKPGRLTLLLGPPGCGKTTLLKALSGNLHKSLKMTGEICYNGQKLEEFVTQKISAYISQYDLHIPEMTVRETLDFSARCQGVGSRADMMKEVCKREKEQGIIPDPDVDIYMKATSVEGLRQSLQTDYILKILGLDICAETLDQPQFWHCNDIPYTYISVDAFRTKFESSRKLEEEDVSKSHLDDDDVSMLDTDSVSKWQVFKACASRELLLMRRNSFVYVFKTAQLFIIGLVTMTVFLRTRMKVDLEHANYYMGALFYALILLLVDGVPELAMTIQRLEVFYKQKQFYFYQAWAYAIPTAILKIPLSLVESLVWTCLTYYVIGFTPQLSRFLKQAVLLFAVHLTSLSMYRLIASICQTQVASMTVGGFAILLVLLFGGFIISHSSMPAWLGWAFWVSPISYGEIGLSVNEFLAPRWQKVQATNTTIGYEVLRSRGLDYHQYLYWISLAALFGFTLVFNTGFVLALTFLEPPGSSRAIISHEKLLQTKSSEEGNDSASSVEKASSPKTNIESRKGRIALPFTPLTVVFRDLQYHVDMPLEMRERGFTQKKLQLLSDLTGALRPGVLTALMGVSGAGKTTLLDVLAGRKTYGYIEGDIKIGGFPKVQKTFARISGYCEQTDIHSPQITVEESLIFSASLRLASDIDSETKAQFVNEVLETIELDGIKDMLVGRPGVSGLSTEQRKRLTIAVELVSNPSIIFMDEPTTGLDARAAAIVMRAVKNVVDTGRTIVCTIHQPSIDIFESFDEMILLKTGGRMIYCGPLGQRSRRLIEYFEHVPGVSKIRENYNPATWMLETSTLYETNKELVDQLSSPPPGSSDLHFSKVFSQGFISQLKACLWKQNLSYWRSPSYNLIRLMHTLASSLMFGALFWKQGKELENQQNLFNIFGSMYTAVIFLGIDNCSSVLPYVSMERTVMYRERFAGMYSSWAYSLAQVLVEVPYLLVQAATYVIVTYPMIGFYGSASKVFWCFYSILCALLYFNYLGMLLVSITPNFQIANILSSAFYTMFNLFSGFLIPRPQIPKWWTWLYYMSPTSWTLNGLLTSQYGDIDKTLMGFQEKTTVSAFLREYFGFHHSQLPLVGFVLILFPLIFAFLFGFCIGNLNFQRR